MEENQKAWIVSVDMGYGHQRAAYPLRHLSPNGKVINANNYPGIPEKDKKVWINTRKFYEAISRFTHIPLIGKPVFNLYDKLQSIPKFYPRRDLSKPILQVTQIYRLIRRGWGKDFINYLNQEDIPLITTFFTVAFFAEEHGFKNEIYCVLCDADISRAWVALDPSKSRIKYLAPCRRVVERLKLYGVKEENIFLTGFPLPEENLGGKELKILKSDLAERLINLDPEKMYRQKYSDTVTRFIKDIKIDARHRHPFTLTFAVGGAGAQRDLAHSILLSLRKKILSEEINFNLVAGTRNDVYLYFKEQICRHGMQKSLGKNLNIIFEVHKEDYFRSFNQVLRKTDILWTKPSELSFYCALGIPIVMAPPLGSQEFFNKTWLKMVGAGISQNIPSDTHEWLFDWVNSGWLAEAAMSGFLDGRQFGVANIKDVVFNGVKEPAKSFQLL
ncbi:MAG TPA: hypothetical protein PKH95_03910 [Candidatus Magasanikbacteria bacterium]|nr:hypothetical protein [Candidatus Magasanikbacteria bacterium]